MGTVLGVGAVLGLLVGCGTPTGAESSSFCEAIVPDSELESYADLEEWRSEWSATGTPENISDEEREGFEVMLDKMEGIAEEDWDGPDTVSRMSMDTEEKEKVRAFSTYLAKECPSEASLVSEKMSA